MTMTDTATYADWEVEQASGKWWILLVTGIAWVLVGVLVLDADLDSAVAIGYLVGGFLIAIGVMEFVAIGITEGWKWLHAVLGALFVVGGVLAFTAPFQTFRTLAALLGFFLVVKGSFDFVIALASRREVDLWWILMLTGIFEVILGFWASGYPRRSAALLILWVGIGALIRGITQLVFAFRMRKIHKAVV